jgi:hypothetical protein
MLMRTLAFLGTLLLTLALLGCSSTKSTFTSRQDDDRLAGISNGAAGIGHQARPYKGIPVTMRVPSHLDVSVIETLFFSKTGDVVQSIDLGDGKRHLQLEKDVIYSDKIITVDPKRPAAGTLDYMATFQHGATDPRDRQFFGKLEYAATDETITTITNILPSLFPAAPQSPVVGAVGTSNDGSEGDPKPAAKPVLVKKTRTVAWKRFDINAVDFESQLAAFAAAHINCDPGCAGASCNGCTACQGAVN